MFFLGWEEESWKHISFFQYYFIYFPGFWVRRIIGLCTVVVFVLCQIFLIYSFKRLNFMGQNSKKFVSLTISHKIRHQSPARHGCFLL